MHGKMLPSLVKIAPTPTGCCLRVEGSGTLRQSPAARDAAARVLAGDPRATVTFDLSACDYLDSTFLGVLIDLYRHYGKGTTPRYSITLPVDKRQQLFGPTNLDRLIPMTEGAPETCGAWVELTDRNLVKRDLARHVMEAHRALAAQTDCPMRDVFARIASQMEAELGGEPRG